MSDAPPGVLVVIITIFFPPLGVFMIGGCGADLFVNVCLTLLGFFPGHLHAFYLEYVYYDRRDKGRVGQLSTHPAPGVFSDNIQSGGIRGYGTL